MNNKDKALNLLGLAQRAGKLVTGQGPVLESIRSKRGHYVILAKDASPRSIKQFTDKCHSYEIALNLDYTNEEISRAIGKNRKSCSLTDRGFAKSFASLHRW